MRRMTSLVTALAVSALTMGVAAQEKPAAADASKTANPELVGELAKELGATPQQAEGAAGALFGVAKSKLAPADWSKVASAVPGMDGLLKAAPAMATGTSGSGVSGAAGALGKTAGGMASAASAFSKLGLKPEMATKAVPVVTRYVSKLGGADVGSLLSGALK